MELKLDDVSGSSDSATRSSQNTLSSAQPAKGHSALEFTMEIALKFLPAFWSYFIFGNVAFAILQFQFFNYIWFLGCLLVQLFKAAKVASASWPAKQCCRNRCLLHDG